MIVAAVRQVADWLVDGSAGVNAQLQSLPTDGTVVASNPPLVTVWDATRFEWVARGAVPRSLTGNGPLLLVRGPDELELPIFGGTGEGGWANVDVLIAYVDRPNLEVPNDYVLTHAYETLRAVARAMQQRFNTFTAAPERLRVSLDRPTLRFSAAQAPLQDDGDEFVLAGLTITIPAFDIWAMGST
jgi:hypothetical protein